MAIARNLALNLDQEAKFNNIAQEQRKCRFELEHILSILSKYINLYPNFNFNKF